MAPRKFSLPLVGDTLAFLSDWQKYLDESKARHGAVWRTSLFGSQTTVVVDSNLAKALLTKHDNADMKSVESPLMADKFYFGGQRGNQTLLHQGARGNKFKSDTWMEAFGPRFMPEFTPQIVEIMEDLLSRMAGQPRASIQQLLHTLTIKIVSTRMYGYIPDETQLLPLLSAMDDFTEDVMRPPLPWLYGSNTKLDRAKQVLASITLKTVAEQTAQLAEYKAGRYDAPEMQRHSLIWHLLEHFDRVGATPTSEDWMANVVGGFFAGHETTRWILCTMIYEVAKQPQTLDRVAAELTALREEFGPEFMASRRAQERMHYTEAVFSEGLRHGMTRMKYMKNIAAFQPRVAVNEIVEGGYQFPAGENILIPLPYMAYSDPTFWMQGEHDAEFRPERFLQGNEIAGWMPFGFGPRTCAGQALASTEGKVMLYLLTLGGYKIDIKDPDEPWRVHGITSTPVVGECVITKTSTREAVKEAPRPVPV